MKTLPIIWQRLVADGKTCGRCGDTHKAVRRAVDKLKVTLRPLGIKPTLETREIDEGTFRANPSESNRIWIAGKPIEEWLGATAGSSRCNSVCSALDCRTVQVEGTTVRGYSRGCFSESRDDRSGEQRASGLSKPKKIALKNRAGV